MKGALIAGVVGLLFMSGGFWIGMRLAPLPKPHAAAASSPGAVADAARPEPITLDALKKTSESMMALNQALQVREQRVAERERKVAQREDELAAERQALDRSHENFKSLFGQFQQRLNLVESSQLEQLQKQAALYTAMGTDQSIELMRGMDDVQLVRLFSVMETKPLSRIVGDWKTKYAADTPRLLHALDGMAQVLPKDKIAISDPTTAAPPTEEGPPGASPAPDSSAPAPDAATPPADASQTAPPSSDTNTPSSAPPAPAGTDSTSPAPAAPPADATPAPLAPPPDAPSPVSTAATN